MTNDKYIIHYVGGKPDTVWVLNEEKGQIQMYGYWITDPDNKNTRKIVKPRSWPKLINSVDKLCEVMKLNKKYVKVMDEAEFFVSML